MEDGPISICFTSANLVINYLKCIEKGKISNLAIEYSAQYLCFEKRICHFPDCCRYFAACILTITRELLGSLVMIVML